MGVTPGDAPSGNVSLEERIDWFCRPSGTMHRKVRLSNGWQKEAFGAMVGRLNTGDVVALIPKGLGGYWYINPSTDEKVRVSTEVARQLDQEATFFYKPLPSRPLKKGDLSSFVFSSLSRSDYLVVLGAATVMTLVGLLPAWANKVAFGAVESLQTWLPANV
ncbi:MAG: hypothetical protein IKF78_02280 [Atopobiaceae bacterium]|nr:hypothetical protein [Atopobiaceae bacterium]